MSMTDRRRFLLAVAGGMAAGLLPDLALAASSAPSFPRLAGYNIGAKHYDDPAYQGALARLDLVILGFYPGWAGADGRQTVRATVRALKARNPSLLVGQYTVLTEAFADAGNDATVDITRKLDAQGWWARNVAGSRVQWTAAYGAWEVNTTRHARADAQGLRYPQWLARRNAAQLFHPVPEFDLWYTDNVYRAPRVVADWDGDGRDDLPQSAAVGAAWRRGYVDYWDEVRRQASGLVLVGNADTDLADPELRHQLDGALLEGIIGPSWSVEAKGGWPAVLQRYRAALANTRGPRHVIFNVLGAPDDLRLMRYAFTTCLLDDGYFNYADQSADYSSVLWYDEFDQRLGRAVDGPQYEPWSNGVWRRRFERGMVLVNPRAAAAEVTLEAGWRRFDGQQDRSVNDGRAVERLTLPARDGIVLVRR